MEDGGVAGELSGNVGGAGPGCRHGCRDVGGCEGGRSRGRGRRWSRNVVPTARGRAASGNRWVDAAGPLTVRPLGPGQVLAVFDEVRAARSVDAGGEVKLLEGRKRVEVAVGIKGVRLAQRARNARRHVLDRGDASCADDDGEDGGTVVAERLGNAGRVVTRGIRAVSDDDKNSRDARADRPGSGEDVSVHEGKTPVGVGRATGVRDGVNGGEDVVRVAVLVEVEVDHRVRVGAIVVRAAVRSARESGEGHLCLPIAGVRAGLREVSAEPALERTAELVPDGDLLDEIERVAPISVVDGA